MWQLIKKNEVEFHVSAIIILCLLDYWFAYKELYVGVNYSKIYTLLCCIRYFIKSGFSGFEKLDTIHHLFVLHCIFLVIFTWTVLALRLTLSVLVLSSFLFLSRKDKFQLNICSNIILIFAFPIVLVCIYYSFDQANYNSRDQFSPFGMNPNTISTLVVFLICCSYVSSLMNILRFCFVCLNGYIIIISASRTGFILCAILLMSVIISLFKSPKKVFFIMILFFIISLSPIAFKQFDFIKDITIFKRFEYSYTTERDFDKMHLSIINSAFLPNGINSFSLAMHEKYVNADSAYFTYLYEMGIFSIFFFITLLLIFIKIKIDYQIVFLVFLANGFTESMLNSPVFPQFIWILLFIVHEELRMKIN